MREACRKAGIEDFRFHDLRHTAKTGWARAGISVEAAMLAAGHNQSPCTITMCTYRRTTSRSFSGPPGKMFPTHSQTEKGRKNAVKSMADRSRENGPLEKVLKEKSHP
jgi:hypothetical protein